MSFDKITSYLSLFTSFSTLLCCALPALLVSLGLGFVVAGMAANIPFFITLSENKGILFMSAFVLLSLNGFLLWRAKNLPCPIDEQKAKACLKARRFSVFLFFLSLIIFIIGAIFAYIAPLFLE